MIAQLLSIARSPDEQRRLWRYYQAGVVNTLVGYGLFAGLIAVGLDMYIAQAVAHVLGMTFNWFSYSRYAFRSDTGSFQRFVLSYGVNYLLSLASLKGLSFVIASPYAAGLVTIVIVSALNYLVLARFVFTKARGR